MTQLDENRSGRTTVVGGVRRSGSSVSRNERVREVVAVTVTVLIIVGVWELLTAVLGVAPVVLRSPQQIFGEFATDPMLYLTHAWTTCYEILIGFAIATVLGVALAVVVVSSRLLQITIYPILLVLQIVPKVAVAPLLIVFLGFGVLPKVVIGVLLAFFPILVNTAIGLRSADREIIDLVRVLNGSRLQEFVHVRFPNAMPFAFGGLKLGMTLAVIGAIIGEFVGANKGLGFILIQANTQVNTDQAYAALIILSAIGLVLYGAVAWLESLLLPWAREVKEQGIP
ncbi:MAG: ABC transporter permease subunit [Propionibacteriales bacterium]|nr:ABC transporter permease subunit [Propionibacteriales bacterium]